MKTFHVKNFEKFQHYKDRSPPWIKLYNEVLDDYDFGALPDASKSHLLAIWLLASRSGNKIPYDSGWIARRINATETVDLTILVERGFILLDQELQTSEQVASKPLAECLSRERGETEDIKQKRDNTVASLPRDREAFERFKKAFPRRDGSNPWQPAEKKFWALVKTGVEPEVLIRAAGDLAREEGKRGNVGTKFIPQAITWLNQQRFQDCAATIEDQDGALDWDAVLTSYKKIGHWSKWAGPDPSSPACRAPPELLAKYGIPSVGEHLSAPPLLRVMQ